jgi:hypothetical protein
MIDKLRQICDDAAKRLIDEYECESVSELSDYFYMHPSELQETR